MIDLLNIDCMEYMATQPDNAFDLAIVDPPYGIHKKLLTSSKTRNRSNKFALMYQEKNWDKEPPKASYFRELFRVSVNQIVWGGNYFEMPISRGWIVWDKEGDGMTTVNNELAWTSFDVALKMFRRCHGLDKGFMHPEGGNIHPTQKPTKLYDWLLKNYAESGQRILDTHLGSGSSAIAAHYFGCDFVGCEIDPDYYKAACERFDRETRQASFL